MTTFDWIVFKNELSRLTVDKDALHIYAALLVQLAAAAVLKRALSSWLPWLAVLAIEIANEIGDVLLDTSEPQLREWQVVGGVHDLVNTMILPTILLLLVRKTPHLFRAEDRSPDRTGIDTDTMEEPRQE